MPKRASAPTLTLPVRPEGTTATRWLYDALRAGILDGRFRPGARLPATRELARQYRLSRGTIVAAFEHLKSEGYLHGTIGSGTYVARVLPDRLLQVRPRARTAAAPAMRPPLPAPPPRRLSAVGRSIRPFGNLLPGNTRAFRANQPALDLFPTTLWAQITAQRFRRASPDLLLGCGPMGYEPLQRAVADYLTTSRGVRCKPEQVAIVSGVQEALDSVSRLFLDRGSRVAIEDPGYIGASLVFEAAGATLVPIPVDDAGLSVDARPLRNVRLVYVTPAHQFPLGVGMSLPRRLALIEWARRAGALILEDDYDSEFRYAGRPVPALQGLDRHGVVLFAGSFSKVLFPSIRLGYLVVPEDLIDPVAALRSITQRHAPLLDQAALADFIVEGHFGRHIRRMREVYAERLSVLLETARSQLAGLLDISPIEAGLQTAAWLGSGLDATAVAAAAARRHVEVTPLSRYARGVSARGGLHLGFAAVDPPELRRGVHELGVVLHSMKSS